MRSLSRKESRDKKDQSLNDQMRETSLDVNEIKSFEHLDDRRFTFSEDTMRVNERDFKAALNTIRETAGILSKQTMDRASSSNKERQNINRLISVKEAQQGQNIDTTELSSRVEKIQQNLAVFQDSFKRAMTEQDKVAIGYLNLAKEGREKAKVSGLGQKRDSLLSDHSGSTRETAPYFGVSANSISDFDQPQYIKTEPVTISEEHFEITKSNNLKGTKKKVSKGRKAHNYRDATPDKFKEQSELFTKIFGPADKFYEKMAFSTYQDQGKTIDPATVNKKSLRKKHRYNTHEHQNKEESKIAERKSKEDLIDTQEIITQIEKLKQLILKADPEKIHPEDVKESRMSLKENSKANKLHYLNKEFKASDFESTHNSERESITSKPQKQRKVKSKKKEES